MGCVKRSSGFSLGCTLIAIGNQSTASLSDAKRVLYAISIPLLLPQISDLFAGGSENPFDFIVNAALENAKQDDASQVLNTLDFDLLINATDESLAAVQKVNVNQTYLNLISQFAMRWSVLVTDWLQGMDST